MSRHPVVFNLAEWFDDDEAEEAIVAAAKKKPKGVKRAPKREPTESTRTRTNRPYPASSFEDALGLGQAIMTLAAGERVRRLTLLEKMGKSDTSSSTRMMITNSNKYGITTGSYATEFFELTPTGATAVNPASPPRDRKKAEFDLAVDGIPPFKVLYDHYKGKRMPEREIIKDVLKDSGTQASDLDECVDTFIVNAKYLGLLRTIGGAETLVTVDQVLEESPVGIEGTAAPSRSTSTPQAPAIVAKLSQAPSGSSDWQKVCFYITPIGSDGSDERKHSDLFMSSLVQPALEELGLTVVRAGSARLNTQRPEISGLAAV